MDLNREMTPAASDFSHNHAAYPLENEHGDDDGADWRRVCSALSDLFGSSAAEPIPHWTLAFEKFLPFSTEVANTRTNSASPTFKGGFSTVQRVTVHPIFQALDTEKVISPSIHKLKTILIEFPSPEKPASSP